jgi:putative heme-binding domain-containing protein
VKPGSDVAGLKPLLTGQTDDAVCAAALRLAGALKAASLQPQVAQWAGNTDRGPQIPAAIEALADLGSAKELRALAGPGQGVARRLWAAAALAQLDAKQAAPLAAAALASDSQYEIDLAPLFAAFLKKKDGIEALGAVLKDVKLSPDSAKLALRAVYAQGHSEPALVNPLKAAANIDAAAKPLTSAEMQQLIADVQSKGDPARGEAIFRRADTACLRCHAIAGAGGNLAPDLSSIGASAPADYLVDSILLPSKAIKEGYHAIIVETTDGDQMIGIKVRQTDKDLILRDALQDEIVIPLNTIKGKPREAGSMMPAGLADPLTRQETLDLVRFLSELGRPGPYAVGPQQLARRWQTLESPPPGVAVGQALQIPAAATWTPAYAQVSGSLPLTTATLARAQVSVTTPGAVRFVVSGPAGIAVWVDDRPVEAKGEATVELTPGVHNVTLSATQGGALRVELAEAPGSPAKAQWVTGR